MAEFLRVFAWFILIFVGIFFILESGKKIKIGLSVAVGWSIMSLIVGLIFYFILNKELGFFYCLVYSILFTMGLFDGRRD